MRLFIAVPLSGSVRDSLTAAIAALRRELPGARFVRPDRLHITLAFLGDQPAGSLPSLRAALEAACSSAAPFSLTLGGLGCFRGSDGDTVWAGLSGGTQPLAALQSRLAHRLTQAGFALERRAFSPHITLARAVHGFDASLWNDTLSPATMAADCVTLFESRLGPGAQYIPLYTQALTT